MKLDREKCDQIAALLEKGMPTHRIATQLALMHEDVQAYAACYRQAEKEIIGESNTQNRRRSRINYCR